MSSVLIVESPGKIKKIQSFIGDGYTVSASCGHIKSLGTTKDLGIDIENNYTPDFIVLKDKREIVNKLKSLTTNALEVYLATDADREGELISYCLQTELKIPTSRIKRAVFTEITKKAILDAIAKSGQLNMNMVHSAFARTVLDKLIGYKVSPTLWNEFKNYHLSAGRVQSVVSKLIHERETEIEKHKASSFFKLDGNFTLETLPKKPTIHAICDTNLTTKTDVETLMNACCSSDKLLFTIDSCTSNMSKRQPSPPYTTSTLQQHASSRMGITPESTMKLAQKLYESGLITYMRTDCLTISKDALVAIQNFIGNKWGDNYHRYMEYKTKSATAQEAHEAIRPTDITVESVIHLDGMTPSHNKLYQMIWTRTVACQMKPAEVEIRTVKIAVKDQQYHFINKQEDIKFKGFLIVYDAGDNDTTDDIEDDDTDNSKKATLNLFGPVWDSLEMGLPVKCKVLDAQEKYSRPANARFTEASLVKKLEDLGIGRPSTYATMTKKVQDVGYVEKKTIPAKTIKGVQMTYKFPDKVETIETNIKVDGDKNKLMPTNLGISVNRFLVTNFESFMDYGFTAHVETMLDEIANGTLIWYKVVDSVYEIIKPRILELSSKPTRISTSDSNIIGIHPDFELPVVYLKTRFGTVLKMQDPEIGDRYAPIMISQADITEQMLSDYVFYPIKLGNYLDKPILICRAKSIFIKYDSKNYSVDIYNKTATEPIDPENISLDTAIKIISSTLDRQHKTINTDKVINNDIVIKVGPFGPYIKFKGTVNIPLPKLQKSRHEFLTEDECLKIVMNFEKKSSATKSESDTLSATGRGRGRGRGRGVGRGVGRGRGRGRGVGRNKSQK